LQSYPSSSLIISDETLSRLVDSRCRVAGSRSPVIDLIHCRHVRNFKMILSLFVPFQTSEDEVQQLISHQLFYSVTIANFFHSKRRHWCTSFSAFVLPDRVVAGAHRLRLLSSVLDVEKRCVLGTLRRNSSFMDLRCHSRVEIDRSI